MTAKLTDRDMLTRMMFSLETAPCCDFFACPGPDHRPVTMATCSQSRAVWELRQYMQRHGGWCPEHGQELSECHPLEQRPTELGYSPAHRGICHCAPVDRTAVPVDRNNRDRRT